MQISINRRSAYAPIRYEATRPFAGPIGKTYVSQRLRGEAARKAFVAEQLFHLVRTAVRKLGTEEGPGPVQSEIANTQIFGEFAHGGKVIFDLDKSLCQTLLLTDAGNIPCGELPFPADSFYLHFGAELDLRDDGMAVEGAFVTRYPDRMMVSLVPQGFGHPHFIALPMGEPLISAPVLLDDPAKSVSQSLTYSVADVLAANARVFEQMEELERQIAQEHGEVVKVPAPCERLGEKGPLLHKALTLIVNAMFYLSAEPEDVATDWGRETPADALDKLRASDKPGLTRTLENTLTKAGYSKVNYVGRRFAQSVVGREMEAATASGKSLATHFRRGHFRRQPYGPESALRKTIFVAPVVVNAGAGGEPKGRIYSVPAPE